MRYEFKLPDIGEGIAEAEIVAWHVKIGDEIGEDQQIADMMTDKATVEMESPVAGKLEHFAGNGAFHFDRGLVGHHVGDLLILGNRIADLDVPGDDFRFGNAFANVRQLEFISSH